MPVQITELNISVSVTQPGSNENSTPPTPSAGGQNPQESLIEDAIEQMAKILNDKKER